MARKTVNVVFVLAKINKYLRQQPSSMMCNIAEDILFETGNYKGFTYVDENGHRVGKEAIMTRAYEEYRRMYFLPEE